MVVRKCGIVVRVVVRVSRSCSLVNRVGAFAQPIACQEVTFLDHIEQAHAKPEFFTGIRVNSDKEFVVDGIQRFVETTDRVVVRYQQSGERLYRIRELDRKRFVF